MIGPVRKGSGYKREGAAVSSQLLRRRLDKWLRICHTSIVRNLTVREVLMAPDAHVTELSEKHRALEIQIETEMARPSVDNLKITRLKREKLLIKDELERLKAEEARVA